MKKLSPNQERATLYKVKDVGPQLKRVVPPPLAMGTPALLGAPLYGA
jgi:hypothetical protein